MAAAAGTPAASERDHERRSGERRGGRRRRVSRRRASATMREELLRADADPVEVAEETTLRPRRLAEFVGQPRLKEHLEIMIGAAMRRGQAVDHLLLAGP